MTCACSCLSAFHWADHPRDSIFLADFSKGASTGMTAGAISTAAVVRYEKEHGRNLGSMYGISAHSDRLVEQGMVERKKHRRAPRHNPQRRA